MRVLQVDRPQRLRPQQLRQVKSHEVQVQHRRLPHQAVTSPVLRQSVSPVVRATHGPRGRLIHEDARTTQALPVKVVVNHGGHSLWKV